MARSRMAAGAAVLGVAMALVLAAGGRVAPSAQTRDTVSAETLAQAQAQTQVLRELVAEVRALRGLVEGYTQSQGQFQTMAELLSLQERRLSDATTRLDTLRRELDEATAEASRVESELASLEDASRRPAASPEDRDAIALQQRMLKEQLERAIDQERRLHARESEFVAAMGLEEVRWNELLDRAQRLLGR